MKNTRLLSFRYIQDPADRQFPEDPRFYGGLVPIEGGDGKTGDIPFAIQRVYTISGVQAGARRGYHSHRNLHQVLIALGGSVKILVKTPYEEQVVTLDSPAKGLYIGPMVWREMFDFSSPQTTLLVLASSHYDESDYIRNYSRYLEEAEPYFHG